MLAYNWPFPSGTVRLSCRRSSLDLWCCSLRLSGQMLVPHIGPCLGWLASKLRLNLWTSAASSDSSASCCLYCWLRRCGLGCHLCCLQGRWSEVHGVTRPLWAAELEVLLKCHPWRQRYSTEDCPALNDLIHWFAHSNNCPLSHIDPSGFSRSLSLQN